MKNLIIMLAFLIAVPVTFAGQRYKETPTVCYTTPTPTEITPTITEEPQEDATPSATLTPTSEVKNDTKDEPLKNDTTHNSNPTCDTPRPQAAAHLDVDSGILGDGKLIMKWPLIIGATHVNIMFQEYGRPFEHGLSNWPDDGHYEVTHLKSNVNYNLCVQGQNGCATGPWVCKDPQA